MSIASQQAELQRAEAKALLGQGVADRIIDCIVGAAMLEITAIMCGEASALARKDGA